MKIEITDLIAIAAIVISLSSALALAYANYKVKKYGVTAEVNMEFLKQLIGFRDSVSQSIDEQQEFHSMKAKLNNGEISGEEASNALIVQANIYTNILLKYKEQKHLFSVDDRQSLNALEAQAIKCANENEKEKYILAVSKFADKFETLIQKNIEKLSDNLAGRT